MANPVLGCHPLLVVPLEVLPGQNCSSLWIIKTYWKVLFSFWEPIQYKKRKSFCSSWSVKAKTKLTPGQVVLPHYLLIASATSLLLEEQLSLFFDIERRVNLCNQCLDILIVRAYFPLDAWEDLVSLYCPSLLLIHHFFFICCNTGENGYCKNMCFNSLLALYPEWGFLLMKKQQNNVGEVNKLKPQQECKDYQ